MSSAGCDHVLYVDDRAPHAELHLTLECGRAGAATRHDVDEDHCAAALDGWLRANPGRTVAELLVTTSRVHHGSLGPVVDVLANHRPEILHLGLGALTFPSFDRGDYIPTDLSRDGSSWNLSVPLRRVLEALPSLHELVVQCNDINLVHDIFSSTPPPPFPEMTRLRWLALRDTALSPAVVSALGASSFPQLESLELWLGRFGYSWGGSARDLIPLLNGTGFGNLRHLTLVSDLEDALVDVLAESELIARLETLRLPFGILGASGALRLRDRWSAFSNLRRFDVTGNAMTAAAARALRETAPDVVSLGDQRIRVDEEPYFAPPLVGLFDSWRGR
ncbi:hypothetical protein [Kribbella soli]|uniref:Leucine-rich repeat domain-containing protein n=1 Tax=Kribbella soli TaxID=1124743 RepID=A0A4V2M0G9_9ACTN|nr:hypothetical protein [Kribbella soli]TCC12026.1 hypothetical protein E0H45_12595 [Kribbella soli]